MSNAQHRFRRRVVLPIALMVAGLIVAVMVLVLMLAERQTSEARAGERSLAGGMLRIRLAEMEKLAKDYSYWDEAFDNLVVRPNGNWARDNIGPPLAAAHGVDVSFVVAPGGIISYAMVNGATSDKRPEQVLKGGFEKLLSDRAAAGPDEARSGLLVSDGVPVLVSVAPLRPFYGPDTGDREARHVLVLADRLDLAQLAHLAEIYRLPALRIAASARQAGEDSIEIRTYDGQASAYLAWQGADPGGAMLRDVLPVILAALLAFAGFSLLVLRQADQSARRLEISERRAAHDALTGLHNRSALLDQLDGAAGWPEARRGYSLLYVDLDGFKQVNDSHGHGTGDEVLRLVAGRLEEALPSGGRAYRLGGDEFAVVLPGAQAPAAVRAAALRLIEAVSMPMAVAEAGAGAEVRVGATVGVALAPSASVDVLDVLRNADQALYAGKRSMRGTVRFHVEAAEAASLVS